MCRKGAGPNCLRLMLTVVGLWNQLAHHTYSSEFTCKKCITELNRAADALRTNSKVVNSLLTRYSIDIALQLIKFIAKV